MPVRFVCSNCQKVLSVTRRKIGEQVECPACRQIVDVPTPEMGASQLEARLAKDAGTEESGTEQGGENVWPREIPIALARSAPPDASAMATVAETNPLVSTADDVTSNARTAATTPAAASPLAALAATSDTAQVSRALSTTRTVPVSRVTIYMQGLLLVAVATLAFILGLLYGRHTAPHVSRQPRSAIQLAGPAAETRVPRP